MFREDGQEYAQVIKMLGNGRLEAQCFDGEKRLAHIRGKMRKKVRLISCWSEDVRDPSFKLARYGRSGLTRGILCCCRYVNSRMEKLM